MIEIKRRPPEPPRYSDPEEQLAGKCMTCGATVACLRRDARGPAARPEPGAWLDVPSAPCPACGARVLVMPAPEFRRAAPAENPG